VSETVYCTRCKRRLVETYECLSCDSDAPASNRESILRDALESATKSLELLSKDNRDEGFESMSNIREYAAKHARVARVALLRAGRVEA
jgi:hypothetical protein